MILIEVNPNLCLITAQRLKWERNYSKYNQDFKAQDKEQRKMKQQGVQRNRGCERETTDRKEREKQSEKHGNVKSPSSMVLSHRVSKICIQNTTAHIKGL